MFVRNNFPKIDMTKDYYYQNIYFDITWLALCYKIRYDGCVIREHVNPFAAYVYNVYMYVCRGVASQLRTPYMYDVSRSYGCFESKSTCCVVMQCRNEDRSLILLHLATQIANSFWLEHVIANGWNMSLNARQCCAGIPGRGIQSDICTRKPWRTCRNKESVKMELSFESCHFNGCCRHSKYCDLSGSYFQK